jgi:nickel superoxide dismutase
MAKIVKSKSTILAVVVSLVVLASLAWPHCQAPCGIYNDQMRFDMISEHIATIEKSIKQITELSAEPKPNMNQIVRWVNNKDVDADGIIRYKQIVSELTKEPDYDSAVKAAKEAIK